MEGSEQTALAPSRGRRRTPLAWRNLVHNKVTLLISIAAIAFAVLIMFMEVGFLNGLYDSQTGAFRALRADLAMVSRSLHISNTHENFPLARLQQAAGFEGVKGAYPIYVEDRFRSAQSGDRRQERHPRSRNQSQRSGFSKTAPSIACSSGCART